MGPHRGYFIYYLIIATFSAGLSSFWVPQSPHLVPQARLPCLQLFTTLLIGRGSQEWQLYFELCGV